MYIICVYDVKEKRCNKLMKLLRMYLFHVQNSVFEGTLTPGQYKRLLHDIDKLINKEEDNIIVYVSYNDKGVYKNEIGVKKPISNLIVD